MPRTPHLPHSAQLALHALTVISMGMMAGFFWTYSANVNLAMLQMDGATYAIVQSAFNRTVRHGLFFIFFFGPSIWCVIALLAAWDDRKQRWWLALAVCGVTYLFGIIFFTRQVNLPLNAITEAWNPNALPSDWNQVRERWNSANLLRTWFSAIAFVLATLTLAFRADSTPQANNTHKDHAPV